MADWWFGTWLLLFHRLGIIIPCDFHIFFRGVGIPATTIGVANIKTLRKSDCWWNMYIAPANYPVVWKELFGSIGIHIPYIYSLLNGEQRSHLELPNQINSYIMCAKKNRRWRRKKWLGKSTLRNGHNISWNTRPLGPAIWKMGYKVVPRCPPVISWFINHSKYRIV